MSVPEEAHVDEEVAALLGGDQSLLDTASEVRSAMHETAIDPAFMRRLQNQVVAERAAVIAEWATRRRSWLRGLRRPQPIPVLAGLAAAAVVLALAVTLLVPRLGQARPVTVVASASASGPSVDPSRPLVVHFSRPMDRASVVAALRITPATAVRSAWRGGDLVITPLHGLVPNAAYVLTVDRSVARTITGASPAADVRVLFGTADAAVPAGAAPASADLPLRAAAAASQDSEAVIAADGTLIATSASSYGFAGVLRLYQNGIVEQLAQPTSAICVSRSGRSLAYLNGSGAAARIVMASGTGTDAHSVKVAVDGGSPLGWINDDEVSFVGGGHLQAVDRTGHVRLLSAQHIDAATDTVVIAPGGRYVFLRPASTPDVAGGQLLDLVSPSSHPLTGIVGDPAFSADGGTVAWFDGSDSTPRLARAPSAGGPVTTVPLPLAAGDQVSDLGISPDDSRVVYSVQHADGGGELRLAAIDDGTTLAVSSTGIGQSPNWAPSGNQVAVLGQVGAQPEIQVADASAQAPAPASAAGALAAAFVNAQVDGDQDAMRALAASGVEVRLLARVSRASVVQVRPGRGGHLLADLRLVIDPTPARPVERVIGETLDVRMDSGLQRLVVSGVRATPPEAALPGPHVVQVGTGTTPGTIQVVCDADLQAGSVRRAFQLTGPGGRRLAVRATYDAATRSAIVSLPPGLTGSVTLTLTTAVRDVSGHHQAAPFSATIVAGSSV